MPEDNSELQRTQELAYKMYIKRKECPCLVCQELLNDRTDWEAAKDAVEIENASKTKPPSVVQSRVSS